jgi:hypothetical protein
MNHVKTRILITVLCSLCFLAPTSVIIAQTTTSTTDPPKAASVYDLLIITPKHYARELRPLVTHKNNVGMKTRLVTLNEVYQQTFWQGRDNPEKIKYFIKHAHEEWGITYVLLVGDFSQMPIRYVYNADNNTGWNEPRFISELYYADLYNQDGTFSSWDTNNNGRYGEWFGTTAADPNIDLYPDVYVGRLACRTTQEVRTVVHKIITYETTMFGTTWSHRMVVAGGDTYPLSENPLWVGNEGEVNTIQALENMTDVSPVTLWVSDNTLTSYKDIVKAVNQGCGFLYISGHGSAYAWTTHPTNSTAWLKGLNTRTMDRLRNRNQYPICLVGGCHNLEFDVSPRNILTGLRTFGLHYFLKNSTHFAEMWKYTWIPECWGWKLLSMPNSGTIATIGCTGLGMSKEDKQSFSGAGDYLEPTLFYEIGTNHTVTLGKAWGNAIADYLHKYPIDWNTRAAWDYAIDAKSVQQWALLGDPSLKIGGYPPLS